MTTLVVAVSTHGATREIAERIASTLRTAKGVNTVVEDTAGAAALLDSVDAVIVAAPVYRGKWHPKATNFVTSHRAELAERSLFLVASGGGPELDPDLAEVLDAHGAREVVYLRGALQEESLNWLEKIQIRLAGGQYGDFRNWNAVEEWAKHVASRGAI